MKLFAFLDLDIAANILAVLSQSSKTMGRDSGRVDSSRDKKGLQGHVVFLLQSLFAFAGCGEGCGFCIIARSPHAKCAESALL